MLVMEMWLRNGQSIIVRNPPENYDNKLLLQLAREVYDSIPEELWQSLRP